MGPAASSGSLLTDAVSPTEVKALITAAEAAAMEAGAGNSIMSTVADSESKLT